MNPAFLRSVAYQHLIRTSEYPYHVTIRSNNREHFYIPMKDCWQVFVSELGAVQRRYGAEIVSFVLMSNHVHMLLWTPGRDLDRIMNDLLREVGRKINTLACRINHVFGTRYKWCLIETPQHFFNAYKYIYRNPVDAQITELAESYAYSTLKVLANRGEQLFPIYDNKAIEFALIPKDFAKRLLWINEAWDPREQDLIRRALRRRHFQLSYRNEDKRWARSLHSMFSKVNDCL